ncbi:MAG: hydroxyacylglutathione hydrolase [Enterobacterales bacterium]
MKIIQIPSLKDNYIWILYNENRECLIVDPGNSEVVIKNLINFKLIPIAIFLTHHHCDHINGVQNIVKFYKNQIFIYGPKEILNIHNVNLHIVHEGCYINVLNINFKVLNLPGHTKNHIGFYSKPWLFCGDVLFSAGCGRIIEGTSVQMFNSIKKIYNLPLNTIICIAHEYTLQNLNFALTILPNDKEIINYKKHVNFLLSNNKLIFPIFLHVEYKVNIFLRINDISLQEKLNINKNTSNIEFKIFKYLRYLKDKF